MGIFVQKRLAEQGTICLPYTPARSFDFRIKEVKLGAEFKKHSKHLGSFPWLLFWVLRFFQGRFNEEGFTLLCWITFWDTELSLGR